MNYFLRWPHYNIIATSMDGRPVGYGTLRPPSHSLVHPVQLNILNFIFPSAINVVMGKSEGHGENWHGHVTVLTVAPTYRRLGIARQLMNRLERISDSGQMYFVDLFVRESNAAAIKMYEEMGYAIFRRVLDYYSCPDEDAYGTILSNCYLCII